jgi:hypothetical protein
MAREFGFTKKERETYFLPEKVYSSFGRDDTDDFVSLCIYSMNDQLLDEISIDISNIDYDESENFIDLDVPKHLRDNGYTEGTYKVVYKFLRRLAGVEDFVFVDGQGNIYEGKVQTKVMNGVERFFMGTPNPNIDEQDRPEAVELFRKELKYIIDDISPDRKEAIVELDSSIRNQEYLEDFQTMTEMIQYKPLRLNNAGRIKFDQKDPYVLEFDINPQDRGFTQNMVGGQIVIPKLYQLENEETTNEDVIVEEIVEVDFFEPIEQDLDTTPLPEPEDVEEEKEKEVEVDYGIGAGDRS